MKGSWSEFAAFSMMLGVDSDSFDFLKAFYSTHISKMSCPTYSAFGSFRFKVAASGDVGSSITVEKGLAKQTLTLLLQNYSS